MVGTFRPTVNSGRWEFAERRRATIGSGSVLANYIGNNSPAPKSAKKPLAGRRILLAEDEGLIALELERMLADFGANVVGPVASVESVLENAERGGLDGAVLDVNLRGRQIFEILPKLQRLGLRLIITSGYDDVTLFPPAFRAVPRIPKPFDERELRRICERVFADPATL
jgi:DNA-binding NtrC family response regulator